MLLSYKMSPIYWPYVLDCRLFTFRQGQEIFLFSEASRLARLLHSCAFMEWTWKRLMCVYSTMLSVSTIILVDDEWINKCEGFVECCWQRKSEAHLLADKHVPLPLCPSQVPRGLACDRTPTNPVKMKRLRTFTLLLRCLLHVLWRIEKNYVIPTNALFFNLSKLSSTWLLHVSALLS